MIARVAVLGLVLVTAALLESVVFAALAVAGHVPSVIVLTVVGVALADGAESGGTYGFVAGLVIDLLGGGLVGLSSLVVLLVGFSVGLVRPYLSGSTLAAHLVAGAVATGAAAGLYGVLLFLLDPAELTWAALAQGVLLTTLYSAALAPLVVRLTVAVLHRAEQAINPR